jgi:predicted dehydrogenase
VTARPKKLKLGLMGCGTVALYGHIPAISATGDLILHAIYDPSAEGLKRARAHLGSALIFTEVDGFFASGLDAVTITSPAPVHKENVLACAAHRLPALCEKPLAMDATEGREMVQAMAQAGVSLHTAFCYRFSPIALKIRELIRTGDIGKPRSLRLIYNWDNHGKYIREGKGGQVLNARREGRMEEGGPMVDCGTHQIDLATFWLNSEVVAYTARGAWVDDHAAPDHMWLHLDHANGAHTMVEMSYSYHHTAKAPQAEFVYEIIGTDGVIRYDRERRSFRMENGRGSKAFKFHDVKDFVGLYRDYANFLRTGKSDLLTSAEAGLKVTDIARNATRIAMGNRPSSNTA